MGIGKSPHASSATPALYAPIARLGPARSPRRGSSDQTHMLELSNHAIDRLHHSGRLNSGVATAAGRMGTVAALVQPLDPE